MGLSIIACVIFTVFLPKSKEQCAEWKVLGEIAGKSKNRAYLTLVICFIVITYGITAAVLLLNTNTSCLEIVGGNGC